jgi:hypothetical protein
LADTKLETQWSVTPRQFEFRLADWREYTQGCTTAGSVGCFSVAFTSLLAWLSLDAFPTTRATEPALWWSLYVAIVVILILGLSFLLYYSRATTRHKKDAAAAATEAAVRYRDIRVQVGGIADSLQQAAFYLDVASREFAQHRYAPFWDAMEAAATAIGQCHTCQGYLAFDIDHYVNALSGREHDFPTWDHAVDSIPEVEPALAQFANLKNAAEADYQFASMREFRETRQVMIAGFKTLGEALRHLENAVVTSIGDLKRAVDRSVLLRAADSAHLQLIAKFLLGGSSSRQQDAKRHRDQ